VPLPGRNGETVDLDNRWIVPYNPYLSRKYRAHINVEVCGSVKAVKYIHKYIYKGNDRATARVVGQDDEISQHLQGRYVGPSEAVWRLFEYPVHEVFPPVIQLAVHLPGQQPVYFDPDRPAQELRDHLDAAHSTLTAFFAYNVSHEDGRSFLYQDFPSKYCFDKKHRQWRRRRGNTTAIGRMYYCNPTVGERFYLRLLLTAVRGPTSFEHLRTVAGTLHPTFQAACVAALPWACSRTTASGSTA
jgi:hypothetical protein